MIKEGQQIALLGALCKVKAVNGAKVTLDIIGKKRVWAGKILNGVFEILGDHFFAKAFAGPRLYLVKVDLKKGEDGKITNVQVAKAEGSENG